MNRTIILLIILVLLAGGVWYWQSTRSSAPPMHTSAQALAQDLYPLYSNANWEVPKAETVTIGTSTYSGVGVSSLSIMPTMDPGSVFTPFERYYDQKLKALGWQVANDLAAGGHVGGQTGYRKGDAVVFVRFRIDYLNVPENAPSECPCDVTLSLFSTGNK